MTVSLKVNNLSISLEDNLPIVDNVSFSIPKGEMLSIVGSSGAGKSTICKAIMGLLGGSYHITGEVMYQSINILEDQKKQLLNIYGNDICYIMQNPMTAFNPSIRVGKQLEKTYYRHNSKKLKAKTEQHIKETLSRLGIKDCERVLKSYPFALSGGMLQRLMIGAALINNPRVLIADEITTAIDACNRMELMIELRKLCDLGLSILFVTHDLKAAAKADSLLIMDKGKMIETGKTNQVFENPKHSYTKHLINASHLQRR